jgi:2-methylcitrate dehydratase PrpD
MSGQSKAHTVVERLAVVATRPVSGADRQRAAWHLLDWLGCCLAGAVRPAGAIAWRVRESGPTGTAFALGALGNILEMDDVDKRATLHPGPTIIPAALVMSALHPGTDLLEAIVRGYEATIRLGRATGPGHYAMWHTTGTCGPAGAAAACASLLDLDAEQTAHALALSISQAAGLWQTRHEPASMGKQLHAAVAARSGLTAAHLANAGFLGPLSILEGEQGFFVAMCAGARAEDVLADFGVDWLIHQVSFKPYAACRHAHAAIDAALMARAELGADDVRSVRGVRVLTYGDAVKFCDRADPVTEIEAKFSLQYATAVTLLRGTPGLDAFLPERLADPLIESLRKRVRVEVSERYDAAYPARFGSGLAITLSDGAERLFDSPDALGDPEKPLSDVQIEAKARTLLRAAHVEARRADDLVAAALRGDGPRTLSCLEAALG